MRLSSLRGALATKQSRGRVLWPLDCFAALAMTVELTQQLLGSGLVWVASLSLAMTGRAATLAHLSLGIA